MCIYCGTNKYRRIYEQHYGPIPQEENGRGYEIHRIDNDHQNNDPSNLKCVTLQEHYNIHFSQEDWGACRLLALRLGKSPEELARLSSLTQQKLVKAGTHHLLGGKMQRQLVVENKHPLQGERNKVHEKIENGTWHWSGDNNPVYDQLQKGEHPFARRADGTSIGSDNVKNGKNALVGGAIQRKTAKKLLEEGRHPSQIKIQCPHCGKIGSKPGMKAWHFEKCKSK